MADLKPPAGLEIEKVVELDKGQTVHLSFLVGRERTYEGRIADRAGRRLEGTSIKCDGSGTISGADGKFRLKSRKARLDSCSFYKEGYHPFELKNVDLEKAPSEITLSGTATFKTEVRIPPGAPFKSPPRMHFIKDGKPMGASLSMEWRMESTGTTMSMEAEIEDGSCVLSIRGVGLKPYLSKPFLLLAGQTYDFGVVYLEVGEAEAEPQAQTGSITVFLTDRAGNAAPEAPLAVMEIRYERPEPGMAAARTDEGGMKVFEGSKEFLKLYADGPRGFLFVEGPALAPCNRQRICRFALNPPNTLAVTIRSLEPEAESFEINITMPLGIARLTTERGKTATFTNLASPADISISANGQEVFATRMDLKDGENALDL